MPSRPSSTSRELLGLYSLASRGEDNLAQFLANEPELVAQLGLPVDATGDDAELALQLAPAVGRYKRRTARLRAGEHAQRAADAALRLVSTSRRRAGRIEVDAEILLGDLLADGEKKYVAFELPAARVLLPRGTLLKARAPLRNFIDLAAYVDEHGLHFRWHAGRGGLNFRPRNEKRSAEVLYVDMRPAAPVRPVLLRPPLLATCSPSLD